MSNMPKYYVYAVKDRGKGKSAIWTRIGAAWPQSKADGLNVELEALPLDGKIVLMPPKAEPSGRDSFESAVAQ